MREKESPVCKVHCIPGSLFLLKSDYRLSSSCIQRDALASLGIRQSPRGERETLPTLGPSGRQLRLNCCAKKRR